MTEDFAAPRLFVRTPLSAGASVDLDRDQQNYLVNVLRLRAGELILVFNGADGEWRATLASETRKRWHLEVAEQTRPQPPPPDLHYLFAPLKQARLDYMVQKAVEMGAGRLRPILTRHTQVTRLNSERVAANAIEAAEQCGILSIPAIEAPVPLPELIETWDPARRIVFCDERAEGTDPVAVLAALRTDATQSPLPGGERGTDPVAVLARLRTDATQSPLPGGERVRVRGLGAADSPASSEPPPLAVLIGPEGGFAEDERMLLRSKPFVTAISLGPRILRADTAAVAALALVQATLGDWRTPPAAPHRGSRPA